MNGLSTKLQEHLALSADWTFLELVSNAITVDDAIHVHQESRRRMLWQLHLVVLPTSTGWCVLHITNYRCIIIISWLPIHRCIRIS
jgi:hypothetical protein